MSSSYPQAAPNTKQVTKTGKLLVFGALFECTLFTYSRGKIYFLLYSRQSGAPRDGFRPFLQHQLVLLFMVAGSGQVGKETFYSRSDFFSSARTNNTPCAGKWRDCGDFCFPLFGSPALSLHSDWRVFF